MQFLEVPPAVRARMGSEGSDQLVEMFAQYHRFATDRFERRMTEEISALRLEHERGRGDILVQMERMRGDVIKWNLLFWVGQFAALTAVMSFLLPGR